MKPGKNKFYLLIFIYIFYPLLSYAEEKIITTPLINLNELKPSFEEVDSSTNDINSYDLIMDKKENLIKDKTSSAKFIGLDKITAKTSDITINLGETKKFGPLEIKVLKCGKVSSENKNDSVAYLQVKDISENQNEKVFIFNGWTFASDPTIAPFDHAIYDLQLVKCNNV
mgnify:FL=1|tara:strand:+ start:180 stop:689 length:510 start_codon:yes stop_codon:yes gene_type:complete